MLDALTSSAFFGLALSAGCWCFAVWLQKKTGLLVCNPVLVASLMIIALLTLFHIPLENYNAGGSLIKLMLGPATAVLALNIYQQRKVLGEHFLPVLVGCLVGSVASIGCVLVLAIAILVSMMDKTIKGEKDFSANYDIPVLGSIPNFRVAAREEKK